MRLLLRTCLIALLSLALIEVPVQASPNPTSALGVVVQADHARLSSGDASSGATVFDGDTLSTDAGGRLAVRLGGSQLYLLGDSGAKMKQSNAGVVAVLQRGTVVLNSPSAGAADLKASAAHIRAQAGPTLAQVTLVSPTELLVTSNRGTLEVTIGEETHVVSEMTSYRVLIEPEVPNPQGGRPIKAARSRFVVIALTLITIGTAIGVWRATISPDRP